MFHCLVSFSLNFTCFYIWIIVFTVTELSWFSDFVTCRCHGSLILLQRAVAVHRCRANSLQDRQSWWHCGNQQTR